jgi:GNAT superfamily N-acetyltransferase
MFVVSGWSTSARGSRCLALIPMWGYAAIMHPIIGAYLDHPTVQTLVSEGRGVLRGFVAADPRPYQTKLGGRERELAGYVYYLYVAAPFRGWGLAAELLAAIGIDRESAFGYALPTRSSHEARGKIPRAEYDPNRARYLTMEKS